MEREVYEMFYKGKKIYRVRTNVRDVARIKFKLRFPMLYKISEIKQIEKHGTSKRRLEVH
jgi:hypothetical protein